MTLFFQEPLSSFSPPILQKCWTLRSVLRSLGMASTKSTVLSSRHSRRWPSTLVAKLTHSRAEIIFLKFRGHASHLSLEWTSTYPEALSGSLVSAAFLRPLAFYLIVGIRWRFPSQVLHCLWSRAECCWICSCCLIFTLILSFLT